MLFVFVSKALSGTVPKNETPTCSKKCTMGMPRSFSVEGTSTENEVKAILLQSASRELNGGPRETRP